MRILLLLSLATGAAAADIAYLESATPAGVAVDSQGNMLVAGTTLSATLPVTPGAMQSTIGGAHDAFVAKFSPAGALIWCTYYGGSADDIAYGIAVDPAGNVLVTGSTQSTNLPTLNAFQNTLQGNFNAFLLKLNSAGQMVYATYLGGSGDIQAYAIAADASGSAYLTGITTTEDFPGQVGAVGDNFVAKFGAAGNFAWSYIYSRSIVAPHGIAVDASGSAYVVGEPESSASPVANLRQAFVFKLSADGSHLVYETFFGGSQNNDESGIVVDASGAAYIAGTTDSADFPRVHSLQPSLKARPLWQSSDGGNTWSPIDNLPFAYLQSLVPGPMAPGTLFAAASDLGVFQGSNNGASWTRISNGIVTPEIYSLAVDPVNPTVMYAGGGFPGGGNTADDGFIFQSEDSGANWTQVDSLLYNVLQVALDPLKPTTVFASADVSGVATTNAGATWSPFNPPSGQTFTSLAIDPNTEGIVYGMSGEPSAAAPAAGEAHIGIFPEPPPPQLLRSTDSGATWTAVAGVNPGPPGLVVDTSTNPATIYDGTAARSNNAGVTWTPLTPFAGSTQATAMAADPASGTLYAAAPVAASLVVSTDHGQTWNSTGWPYADATITGITPTPGALFATVQNNQTSAFVVKISPDGSTVLYSTLLSGHPSLFTIPSNECGPSVPIQCGDPVLFQSQNYATGIALDPAGNIVVAGGTLSADFPTADPLQAANAGGADAFVAVISADGSQLLYSTYLGGSQNDGASGVAVDSQGNVVVAGQTDSPDFLGGSVPQTGAGSAFVGRVYGPPAISSVLNAASFTPGIEAGSWVMIQGSNLSNITRTWEASDFNGDNLPTALSGVSVTIDGYPGYVEYISPTQINVQAPADSATGPVNVVVNNNGSVSAPAQAQLQTAAPAFFLNPGTTNALYSYGMAQPGATISLWGTGFGAVNPAVPPGVIAPYLSNATTLPTITIGGIPAPVEALELAPGYAGLYQINVHIPSNVPTGPQALQAALNGVTSAAGVTLLIGAQ